MKFQYKPDGNTSLVAHIGYPTSSFKSPLIYNPYFDELRLNTLLVPFACESEHFEAVIRGTFLLRNILGALITMPHKVAAFQLADEVSVSASIAGACNALRLSPDGTIIGDQFDGEGFVRGLESKEIPLAGESALVMGTGGVGRAICASLAGRGIKALGLSDPDKQSSQELQDRLQRHYPDVKITVEDRPYTGNYRLLVNATPLGMNANDPLPLDPSQLGPHHIVADVVLTKEMTPFLVAAKSRGCQTQTGLDMLYEQIPAYLRFFGLPTTTAQHLRSISRA